MGRVRNLWWRDSERHKFLSWFRIALNYSITAHILSVMSQFFSMHVCIFKLSGSVLKRWVGDFALEEKFPTLFSLLIGKGAMVTEKGVYVREYVDRNLWNGQFWGILLHLTWSNRIHVNETLKEMSMVKESEN